MSLIVDKGGYFKMKGKLIGLLMGATLVLSACGDKEEASTTKSGDPEKLYTQSCAQCHGTDLKGVNPNFPDLNAIGSKLTKEEIEKTILEGKGVMPPRKLEGEEASAVAEWLAEKK